MIRDGILHFRARRTQLVSLVLFHVMTAPSSTVIVRWTPLQKFFTYVVDDTTASKENIVEKIKENLQVNDPQAFDRWAKDNFKLNHIFEEGGGGTILHFATANSSSKIVHALIDLGCDVNAVNSSRQTPLHWAVRKAARDEFEHDPLPDGTDVGPCMETLMTQILIDRGSNIEASDVSESTPLLLAVVFSHIDTVEVLIEKGAKVNVVNKDGDTPLHLALREALHDVVKLLVENKADINAKNRAGQTVFHLAGKYGDWDMFQYFAGKYADTTIKDNSGNTPLFYAKGFEDDHPEVVEYLTSKMSISS